MLNRSLLLSAFVLVFAPGAIQAQSARAFPPPAAEAAAPEAATETAVLAGGCFWGIQAVYQHVKGVTNAVSGYAGGSAKDASYPVVSSGETGHAEAVQVIFDPRQISYGKILQIYFSVAHDPTEIDRQGPDFGRQYRSEIFPQSEAQAKIAQAYVAQLDQTGIFKRPIATRTGTMKTAFFPAEAYHQDYATKHPYQPYIMINDAPKVASLKTMYPELWRDKPVLVADAAAGQ